MRQTVPMKPKLIQMGLALAVVFVLTPQSLWLWQDPVRFVMLQKYNV